MMRYLLLAISIFLVSCNTMATKDDLSNVDEQIKSLRNEIIMLKTQVASLEQNRSLSQTAIPPLNTLIKNPNVNPSSNPIIPQSEEDVQAFINR